MLKVELFYVGGAVGYSFRLARGRLGVRDHSRYRSKTLKTFDSGFTMPAEQYLIMKFRYNPI